MSGPVVELSTLWDSVLMGGLDEGLRTRSLWYNLLLTDNKIRRFEIPFSNTSLFIDYVERWTTTVLRPYQTRDRKDLELEKPTSSTHYNKDGSSLLSTVLMEVIVHNIGPDNFWVDDCSKYITLTIVLLNNSPLLTNKTIVDTCLFDNGASRTTHKPLFLGLTLSVGRDPGSEKVTRSLRLGHFCLP